MRLRTGGEARPMNRTWLVRLCLPLALVCLPLAAASLKDARKAKQGEAKRLAVVAQKQEKAGDFIAARASYLQSAGVCWNKDAEKGLERISQALDKQVRELLEAASRTYAARNFAKTGEMLERARTLEPGNPA